MPVTTAWGELVGLLLREEVEQAAAPCGSAGATSSADRPLARPSRPAAPARRLLHLLAEQQADQLAPRGRHGHVREIVLRHERRRPRRSRCSGGAWKARGASRPRSSRRRPGRARSARRRPITMRASLTTTQASQPAARTRARTSRSGLLETTRRDVPTGDRRRRGTVRRLALDGEAGRHPVRLAGPVLVHLAVPQALEPPRGSWAQISGGVPAIHDHAAAGVEDGRHAPIDRPQRKIDRAGEMPLLVLSVGNASTSAAPSAISRCTSSRPMLVGMSLLPWASPTGRGPHTAKLLTAPRPCWPL